MENSTRIEIAREVMAQLLDGYDTKQLLGVIAYGHRWRGDGNDIEVLVPPSNIDPATVTKPINARLPKGKTPLLESLRRAGELIPKTAEDANILLITDGLEIWDGDPCAVAKEFLDSMKGKVIAGNLYVSLDAYGNIGDYGPDMIGKNRTSFEVKFTLDAKTIEFKPDARELIYLPLGAKTSEARKTSNFELKLDSLTKLPNGGLEKPIQVRGLRHPQRQRQRRRWQSPAGKLIALHGYSAYRAICEEAAVRHHALRSLRYSRISRTAGYRWSELDTQGSYDQ